MMKAIILRDVPRELHRKLKIKSAQEGQTMKESILILVSKWLEEKNENQA